MKNKDDITDTLTRLSYAGISDEELPKLREEIISYVRSVLNFKGKDSGLNDSELCKTICDILSYDGGVLHNYADHVKKNISVAVGDILEFGTYNDGQGVNLIKWKVLAKEDRKALLITEYGIDWNKYNEQCSAVTWETCTLREWLNTDFYNAAFSSAEKGMISLTNVTADRNPEYNTNPGNDTHDKVFLLSINEVNRYFVSDEERKCKPTDYAITNGACRSMNNGNGWWWLRSPGYSADDAAFVETDGSVDAYGSRVYGYGVAVRPALWINLKSSNQ